MSHAISARDTRAPRQSAVWVLLATPLAALALVPVAAAFPELTVLVVLGVFLVAAVMLHPPLAAYLLIAVTPLVVGIDRGRMPGYLGYLRPNEALALVLGGALVGRALLASLAGRRLRFRFDRIDATLITLALAASAIPMLWMTARGRPVTLEDILHALALWKYYGAFLLFRASVRTAAQVHVCLWLSMAAAALVAVAGILQVLQLFGAPQLLSVLHAPLDNPGVVERLRASSTIGSSLAVADVMTFNLAIALGLLARGSRHRVVLASVSGLFVFGVLAAGQFSGVIALVIGLGAVGLVMGRLGRTALYAVPSLATAAMVLQPVVQGRLSGFESRGGVPPSWLGRLDNLRTFFWPELFSDFNWILGVRTSSRVAAPERWRVWVWIESGHTWLLWNGGIPLFIAFFVFVWTAIRTVGSSARERTDAIGVAAIASYGALWVMAILMLFDSHLTLRGSADLSFALLALATTAAPSTALRNRKGKECASPSSASATSAQ